MGSAYLLGAVSECEVKIRSIKSMISAWKIIVVRAKLSFTKAIILSNLAQIFIEFQIC